jgi:hypothetical protein
MAKTEFDPMSIGAHNPRGTVSIPGISLNESMNGGKIPGITPGMIPKNAKPHYLVVDPGAGVSFQQWQMLQDSGMVHTITLKNGDVFIGTARVENVQKPGGQAKFFLMTDTEDIAITPIMMRDIKSIDEGAAGKSKNKPAEKTKSQAEDIPGAPSQETEGAPAGETSEAPVKHREKSKAKKKK